MLLPIHKLDLLYYKNQFRFFVNKLNADNPNDEPVSLRFVDGIVERAFCMIESVYNAGPESAYGIDDIVAIATELPPGLDTRLPNLVEIELKHLRTATQKAGWDKRIKIKVKERSVGNALQLLSFHMDLDETIYHEMTVNKREEESEVAGFDIIDNPTAEQLCSYDKTLDYNYRDTYANDQSSSSQDNDPAE